MLKPRQKKIAHPIVVQIQPPPPPHAPTMKYMTPGWVGVSLTDLIMGRRGENHLYHHQRWCSQKQNKPNTPSPGNKKTKYFNVTLYHFIGREPAHFVKNWIYIYISRYIIVALKKPLKTNCIRGYNIFCYNINNLWSTNFGGRYIYIS